MATDGPTHAIVATLALAAAELTSCSPVPPPAETTERANSAPTLDIVRPEYPKEYRGSGRTGMVVATCDISVEGDPSHCALKSVEGGKPFGDAVLNWLNDGTVHYRPARRNGEPVAVLHHILAIKFVSNPEPSTASAICDVSAAGEVSNCALQSTNGGVAFGEAVMKWLKSGKPRFRPDFRDGKPVATPHHTIEIAYHPPLSAPQREADDPIADALGKGTWGP